MILKKAFFAKTLFIILSLFVITAPKSLSSSMLANPINPRFLFKTTYYCPGECCNGIWAGISKTGKPLKYGMVAIDEKYWKMGQKFKLPQFDKNVVFIAEDVGSAIKGKKRMDICVPTHADTLAGHPEHMEVVIVRK